MKVEFVILFLIYIISEWPAISSVIQQLKNPKSSQTTLTKANYHPIHLYFTYGLKKHEYFQCCELFCSANWQKHNKSFSSFQEVTFSTEYL